MNSISFRHQLLKIANFLQSENTKIFQDKFSDKEPELVKSWADRSYAIFGTWKDYDGYRLLLASLSNWEEMEGFISKCEKKLESLVQTISSLGFPPNAAGDMSRQYLHKYLKDLDSPNFLNQASSAKNKADFISLLRGEKKKKDDLISELEGKDLSDLSKEHIAWVTKIIELSKGGGEAHGVDDILSLVKSFKRMEGTTNKKIGDFSTYSELSKFIDDKSFTNKAAYIHSIKDVATSGDMSKVIYDDDRWKVVLIGSAIGGQWWGRDTSFCISSLSDNLFSSYAVDNNVDPYFIIDKMAESSNKMRKFTLAIEYEGVKTKISEDQSTMTDANNVGISFGQIKNYLGQDSDKLINLIKSDAATRNKSLGAQNTDKINHLIESNDQDAILKYEKEICANDSLFKTISSKIETKNDVDKNFKILSYVAGENPLLFLSNFARKKDIAPELVFKAAKIGSEENPVEFISGFFPNRYVLKSTFDWVEPYLDTAIGKTFLIDDKFSWALSYASGLDSLSSETINAMMSALNKILSNKEKLTPDTFDASLVIELLFDIYKKTNDKRILNCINRLLDLSKNEYDSLLYSDNITSTLSEIQSGDLPREHLDWAVKSLAINSSPEFFTSEILNQYPVEKEKYMELALEGMANNFADSFEVVDRNSVNPELYNKYAQIAIKNVEKQNPSGAILLAAQCGFEDLTKEMSLSIINNDRFETTNNIGKRELVVGSYYFLTRFSKMAESFPGKDELLDLAAKQFAKSEPRYFILPDPDFKNKESFNWFVDNIGIAAMELINKDPQSFIFNYSYIPILADWIQIAKDKLKESASKPGIPSLLRTSSLLRLAKTLNKIGLSSEADMILKLKK